MPIVLDGSLGVTTPMYNGTITANAVTPSVNMKNRIINGACVIDQRNAGASVTPTDSSYTLDRWKCRLSQASKYTVQQNAGSVTPPDGFRNYLGVTSLSAYSVGTSDYFAIQQVIEGFNVADLGWGTANAKTITISFWVRSSLTGTFGGALNNGSEVRAYGFTYTISAANTWEQKTITITGDTSGTWLTTNGIGLYVNLNLGTGSTYGSATNGAWGNNNTQFTPTGATSVVGTNGATFYITGVQLEVGSTATSFDYRSIGTELQLCQRYYITVGGQTANQNFTMMQAFSTTNFNSGTVGFPVFMRANPTLSYSSLSHFYVQNAAGNGIVPTAISQDGAEVSLSCGSIRGTVAAGLVAGNASPLFAASTSARLNWSAEL